ncbi:MAG: glutamine synthetase family protein [Hyphomicrobiaceae bacterium]
MDDHASKAAKPDPLPKYELDLAPPTKKSEVLPWLRAHRIDEVECAVPDIAGIARGKAMPAVKFADLKPMHLPVSIFFQGVTGDYVDFEGDQGYTEGDLLLVPDLSTLRPAPWSKSPTAQVIHDVLWQTGEAVEYAPRSVLKRVLKLYAEEGWEPVVAPEIEFYLTQKNPDPDYPLEPPVGRSGRVGTALQSYALSGVDEYAEIVDDLYDFAEAQRLEIDTIIQEGGTSQLEINLQHGNALELADQVFFFKRTLREAALRHGCYATFMAKPMEDEPGSAMHIHQSVVDVKTGRNIFSDAKGQPTALFYGFVGGQQEYLPAAACFFAPYVNSYRRLVPDAAAPINVEWGMDNRTTGLRVPVAPPEARRIENRLPGADTNPYLVLAASLACGLLGMKQALKPREPVTGSAYESSYQIPRSLLEAVAQFQECQALQEMLGPGFSALYGKIKHAEFENFMRVISPWEREHLLLTV